jgi:hypothetical protein
MSQESEFANFKSAIARIYSKNGIVVGAGFLVAPDCVLTCAHVITSALGLPQNTMDAPDLEVELDFPLSQPIATGQGKVILWQPVIPGQIGEDMAVLQLTSALPIALLPVKLAADSGEWDARIRMFGFPKDFDDGIWVTGKLRDRNAAGLVQMDAIAGAGGRPVEKGFSGAPIWDESLQAVVGMAIAAEKRRETVTAAFMTPHATLAEYAIAPLETQQLTNLLNAAMPDAEAFAQAVHSRLRPTDWQPGQPQPTALKAVLQDLTDMPGQAGHEPLHLLIAAFLASPQITADAQQPLRDWLQTKSIDIPALIDAFLQIPPIASTSEDSTVNPYLLVLVRPSRQKPEEYFVDGWFLTEVQKADGTHVQQRKQLDLPISLASETVPDTNEMTFPIKQIPAVVATFWNQIGGEGNDTQDLTVEVFVPLKLLDQAVHGWVIEDQFGFASPLCRECQRVVLRSYERLARNYRPRGLWQKKWAYVETVLQQAAQGVFIPFEMAKVQALKETTAIAVKITQGDISTARGGPLALILGTATPIALWLQQQLNSVQEFEALLDCCLYSVLDSVSQTRRDAYDSEDENHLGRHLSLVWENPHRVPPDIDYSI